MRSPLSCLGLVALTAAFIACARAPELDEDDSGFDGALGGNTSVTSSSGSGLASTSDGSGGATSGTGGKPSSGEGGGKTTSGGSVSSSSAVTGTSVSSAASSGSGGGVPAAWTCDTFYYAANDGCDCGCGVQDPDCLSANAMDCDYCTDSGSCGVASCPGNINPTNNATCFTVVCGDNTVGPGEQCDDGNTTNGDGCDSQCQLEVPAAWTCSTSYYAAQDGCDCGCGVIDPDCSNATAAACDYCQDSGSCGNAACPGNINATNNAVCN